MAKILQQVLDWSEVWAVLIPVFILLIVKKQPDILRPVVFYVWASLAINCAIDLAWKLNRILPAPYNSNNYLYNLHSIVRFYFFSAFFIRLKQPFLQTAKKIIPLIYGVYLLINFLFFEKFFNYYQFSSRSLAVEAIVLLFYTLQYYLFKINESVEVYTYKADFWIVTGLGIYVTINFFIFLLYNELTIRMQNFAINLWNVHNITYIIFNIFITKGFYESRKH